MNLMKGFAPRETPKRAVLEGMLARQHSDSADCRLFTMPDYGLDDAEITKGALTDKHPTPGRACLATVAGEPVVRILRLRASTAYLVAANSAECYEPIPVDAEGIRLIGTVVMQLGEGIVAKETGLRWWSEA